MSSGRRDRPPATAKRGTDSSKKHRFESFNQRIAKLNIDPIRRVRRQDVDQDDVSTTTSYLKSGLAYWKDINMSENFTAFVREVEPLCDSLPQILHSHQKIVDILSRYLEMKDALSLEALLSLTSHFAHDMGTKFEAHFVGVVTIVVNLAAKHPAVEVVEWSFSCLTWLFKYLSRLLVPVLSAVYDITAPLLGKETQKRYVTRFAAEAMSFLVRKAAQSYDRSRPPVAALVEHVMNDLQQVEMQERDTTLYQYGIMTLFADSVKGINRGTHSCGAKIYTCLLEVATNIKREPSSAIASVLCGITTNIIHHTEAASFSPILDLIIKSISTHSEIPNASLVSIYGKLLLVVAAVRKGSRISNWQAVIDSLICVLQLQASCNERKLVEDKNTIEMAAAVILQYAPLDSVTPKIRTVVESIIGNDKDGSFLLFCDHFCELGKERFHALVSPYFYKYLASDWREHEPEILVLTPKLLEDTCSTTNRVQRNFGTCPKSLQEHIVNLFEARADDMADVILLSAYLDFLKFVSLEVSVMNNIVDGILAEVASEVGCDISSNPRSLFYIGAGLESVLRYSHNIQLVGKQLWPDLCSSSTIFGTIPLFLENLLLLCELCEVDLSDRILDPLITSIINNLASPETGLRRTSLRFLNVLHRKLHGQDAEVLNTALAIENTPLDLQSARIASMHIRRLSAQYPAISTRKWLDKAVPYFCFGLLTVKLAQLWDDAVDVLKVICHTKLGEDTVSDLAFRWMEGQAVHVSPPAPASEEPSRQKPTEFQCPNYEEFAKIARQRFQLLHHADEHLQRQFVERHQLLSEVAHSAASQALRVFVGIPHIAEKRSRRLVPLFLQWSTTEDDERMPPAIETFHMATPTVSAPLLASSIEQQEPSFTTLHPSHGSLARRDRKIMIKLLGSFTNPRVLYRSPEVFDALLGLLANGDSETQKLALNAIATWKLEGVGRYLKNLTNLLDDSRFREEVSVFLQIADGDSTIQQKHRPELMPVLLRLLYGKLIARSGGANGSKGLNSRRRAVLETLPRLSETDVQDFLFIALGRLKHLKVSLGRSGDVSRILATNEIVIAVRKQVGIVTMIKDMLETMGGQLAYLCEPMANALLYCMGSSTAVSSIVVDDEIHVHGMYSSLQKVVRQIGLQCLTLMFRNFPAQKMRTYVPLIFSQLLNPRLDRLPIETAQSVSGTLELFATFSSDSENASHLIEHNSSLLVILIDCLGVPSAKDEVKLFVINSILKPLVIRDGSVNCRKLLLGSNVAHLLQTVGSLMRKSPSKQLLESTIELTSTIAPIVDGSSQARDLLDVSIFLLDQPAQRVSPRTKGNILQILQHFVPLLDPRTEQDIFDRLFLTVSSLFGYFKDRSNRSTLSVVFSVLARSDPELEVVASLNADLNSFSGDRIDNLDFEKRLKAFNTINEVHFRRFTLKQWRPIVYNMLYYIKDNEELAIRSSASYTLRRFIEENHALPGENSQSSSELLRQVVLPALRHGAFERSELVRVEYLTVMAHLIRCNPDWTDINDMIPLLVDDDEEASFFSNVLHIQHHRRLRALRRLATETSLSPIRSANIAHFLMPLLEHFIFDKADDESAHNLAAEATNTIGVLSKGLEWSQLRALFRRLCGYMQSKPDDQKATIKLIGVLVDAIGHAERSKRQSDLSTSKDSTVKTEMVAEVVGNTHLCTLGMTMPKKERLAGDLTKNLLPSLIAYLHDKDESTVSLRVRVAVSVVKLLGLLPEVELAERLSPILTDVCHILRSRAQESRDMTRLTLVEIAMLIGPAYFGFMMKELRSSLARGYQLHVLSYTLHSILVATAAIFKPGDLDYCLPQIVAVIMDDIFGTAGQEKDAEEYISKMKEVKSSKSFDSMELISKISTINHLVHLLRPLQTLLEERLDLKMVKKIDELLRRVGVGLLHNGAIESRETLVFCYEVLRDANKPNSAQKDKPTKEDYRMRKYLVNARTSKARVTPSYRHKLARFSLDVLRSVLHKYVRLQTAANLSGLMPAIGDALVDGSEEVKTSAFRLLATVIRVEMQEIDEIASLFLSQALKVVKNTTSTSTGFAQAALKLISAFLRERHEVHVRDIDIAYLLKRLRPDLEEPDRQGVTFTFLKAVIARRIIVPEVYEVLDGVTSMMITNQAQSARDMARGVYFQFILNYPQGKARLSKQLGFLLTNLDYKHVEGRQSVMEAIHLFITKLQEDLVQDLVRMFFVPLVMVTINDDSIDCRKMSGVLLKKLFERADAEQSQNCLTLLRSWLSQDEQPLLRRVSLQTYRIYIEVNTSKIEKELPFLQTCITEVIRSGFQASTPTEWETVYSALELATKMCNISYGAMLKVDSAKFWVVVRQCLYFPHAWVKLAAATLLGHYFRDFTRQNVTTHEPRGPLTGSGGLRLEDEDMRQITKASLGSLRVSGVSKELAFQSAQNLVFLGKVMAKRGMMWSSEVLAPDDEEDSDNNDDDDTFSHADKGRVADKTALQYIFERLSATLRRESLSARAPALVPKTAALQLITALCNHLPVKVLAQSVDTILLPLHNLTDPSIAAPHSSDEEFRTTYQTLASTSQETMSLLQKKLGTTDYIARLNVVRQGVKERREGRRVKRRMEAVAEPEKAGRGKRRKGEKRKEKRKERSGEERSRRRGW
ncbi:U3 snoRNP protein [Lambiella insularis]|nr:U3 snoRNP protein [Lambiella insularis]